MEIKSLCWMESRWQSVNVEILLAPGLPQIQYLGLADRSIKEGATRVKSALRRSGFEFPSTQQIIVNITPSSAEKSSAGIDLAVAVGLLQETGQIPLWDGEDPIVFGELGLDGKIVIPSNFKDAKLLAKKRFVGNPGDISFEGQCLHLQNLKDLKEFRVWEPREYQTEPSKATEKFHYSEDQAEWLVLQNLGEFHTMLAGPQGMGKSTIVKDLPNFLEKDYAGEKMERPFLAPHHSITMQALIGGGASPKAGEITRAHQGVLFLDEFLEFDVDIIESLRRPFEDGQIEITRVGSQCVFPCETTIIAATNLCPCGKWVPGLNRNCSYSRQRCFKSVHRLSGPLLDRFQILYLLPNERAVRNISADAISERINKIRSEVSWKENSYPRPLRLWPRDEFKTHEWVLIDESFQIKNVSERRKLSTLRVAKAFQWMDGNQFMSETHIEKALRWTLHPFEKLEASIY
ncbi:MAG: ATP-binding protein [Bdellovibrionota bacterium]